MARIRSDRNATLVRHHNETVWIPPHGRIELFKDVPEPERRVEDFEGGAEDVPAAPDGRGMPGTMPGHERERIAIEEGARAEYWRTGVTNRGWAFVSFVCSFVAGVLLVGAMSKQVYEVGHAAGFGWLSVVTMVVIGALTIFGAMAMGIRTREPDAKG